jgi:hypothetical protein
MQRNKAAAASMAKEAQALREQREAAKAAAEAEADDEREHDPLDDCPPLE